MPHRFNELIMSRINHKICPVCGSEHLIEFLNNFDYSISREDFELYKCTHCGFVLTQDVPDEESIGKYYKSDVYISHSDTNKGFINKIYHAIRAIMLDKKAKMIEAISGIRKGKLLDIGTGLAYFPNHMKSRGWQVEGIEQDPEARQSAEDNFGIKAKAPEALYQMEKEDFDVISMWHVLEHVHDLEGYMKAIKANLKEDGMLVIALPNMESPDAKHYGKFWAAYDVPRHLWHWNPTTFKKFAEKHGFLLMEKRGMPMDGFYVSLMSEKYKKGKMNLFSGFILGLSTWFKSLNNTDLSSSIIYFLKKK